LNQGQFAPVDRTPEALADARARLEQQIEAIDTEFAAEVAP
jgi:hypothetical protein